MFRVLVLICVLGLLTYVPVFAVGSSDSGDRPELRFGELEASLGLSIYSPDDVNDFADELLSGWAQVGANTQGSGSPLGLGFTLGLSFHVRVWGVVQVEPWVEYFSGGSRKLDISYIEPPNTSVNYLLTLKPTYFAPGVTVCLAPRRGRFCPKLGVGVGRYSGTLKWDGEYVYESGVTYYQVPESYEFQGTAWGFHAVAGAGVEVADNVHLEALMIGRRAKIAEIRNDAGNALVFLGGSGVELDFSGFDVRVGVSLAF